MTENAYLLWGLGLIGAALLIIVIELFVPSFGVLAVAATACAITGVVFLWLYDAMVGLMASVTLAVLVPIGFAFFVKTFPHTPIGRWIFLNSPEPEEVIRERQKRELDERLALVGAEGQAMTALRPVGVVRIDGKRYDALSDGPMIEAGAKVRVVSVDGTQVKVRQVSE